MTYLLFLPFVSRIVSFVPTVPFVQFVSRFVPFLPFVNFVSFVCNDLCCFYHLYHSFMYFRSKLVPVVFRFVPFLLSCRLCLDLCRLYLLHHVCRLCHFCRLCSSCPKLCGLCLLWCLCRNKNTINLTCILLMCQTSHKKYGSVENTANARAANHGQ